MKPELNILFIIGTGRCGSSLIHEMIARHRSVGFISNIDDNLPALNLTGRFNSAIFRSPIGRFTKKGQLRFAPSEAFHLITRQVSPIYMFPGRNPTPQDVTPELKKGFRRFFIRRYRAQGKHVFIHKYTGWSRMAFFKEIFPEARFVHVVRDGRAVANSFLQMAWWDGHQGPDEWIYGSMPEEFQAEWRHFGKSRVTMAGLTWKMLLDSIEKDQRQMPDDSVRTFVYEDFLHRSEHTLGQILRFAGLDWNPDYEKQIRKDPVRSGRKEAFRQDLSPADLEELEACIGDKLRQYGYI